MSKPTPETIIKSDVKRWLSTYIQDQVPIKLELKISTRAYRCLKGLVEYYSDTSARRNPNKITHDRLIENLILKEYKNLVSSDADGLSSSEAIDANNPKSISNLLDLEDKEKEENPFYGNTGSYD
jgi:hypothetical protein